MKKISRNKTISKRSFDPCALWETVRWEIYCTFSLYILYRCHDVCLKCLKSIAKFKLFRQTFTLHQGSKWENSITLILQILVFSICMD